MRLRMIVDVEVPECIHGKTDEEWDAFVDVILAGELVLHSNEIGDTVGMVNVLEYGRKEQTP